MTNTTGIAKLLAAALMLMLASSTQGQETPPPPVEFVEPGSAAPVEAPSVKKYLLSDELRESIQPNTAEMWEWDACPAPPESSGTWLRRGWWSAEMDAVVMVRKWDRRSAFLASDATTTRILQLDRTSEAEGSARITLGRFLFRDIDNRDHTMEFSVFGGNEFLQTSRLESDLPNDIGVSFFIDGLSDASFNGASIMDVTYASRFNSFELNYKVTSRMKRDRMELQPDGRWIRRASPGFTYHGIAGMRYLDLTETVIWTAEDIINVAGTTVFTGEDGRYDVEANNDMFGFQAGGGMTYEADRWSLSCYSKGGVMMNDAKSSSVLTFTDPATNVARTDVGFTNHDRDGSLPLLLQAGILGRYHLRPNVSIRAGYELLYLTAVSVAPHNINFNPDDNKIRPKETPFYHGLTLGGEFFW